MNLQQAENIRTLIRHAEGAMTRTLDMMDIMDRVDKCTREDVCGTPACMLGEAIAVLRVPEMIRAYCRMGDEQGGIWPSVIAYYGKEAEHRLFGMASTNAWGRRIVTPQEWAVEARKVLAENGYSMDEAKPIPSVRERLDAIYVAPLNEIPESYDPSDARHLPIRPLTPEEALREAYRNLGRIAP